MGRDQVGLLIYVCILLLVSINCVLLVVVRIVQLSLFVISILPSIPFKLNLFFVLISANILKVYGDRINPEIPYKSLLLLPTDSVSTAIRDALDKYGLGKEKTEDYNLIQVLYFAFLSLQF